MRTRIFSLLLIGCSQPAPAPCDCKSAEPVAGQCVSATSSSSASLLATSNAQSTFALMQAAACAGDADGFFAHVDSPRVRDALTEHILANPPAKPAILPDEAFEGALLSGARKAWKESEAEWREDIRSKKAQSGPCLWKVKGWQGDKLTIERSSGNTAALDFKRIGGEYFLARYDGSAEKTAAPPSASSSVAPGRE